MSDSNQPQEFTFTGSTGTDLSQVTMAEIYRDLITINDSDNNNQGVTGGLKFLRDGAGTTLPLQISETDVSVLGDLYANDIHIGNTINLDNIDQYLFNVDTGTTGTIFKIRVGDTDVFSIDAQGNITSPSIGDSSGMYDTLKFNTTAEEDVEPEAGMLRFDGDDLLLYK